MATTLEKQSGKPNHAAFYAELEPKPEFQIVSKLSGELTAEAAVQQIQALTEAAAAKEGAVGNHLYDTACSVIEMAAQISQPEAREKLVALVLQLQHLVLKDPLKKDEPLVHDDERVWADLPTFGYTFADELGSFSVADPNNDPRDCRRWENMTAFVARLAASQTERDYLHYALTALNAAFGPYFEGESAPVNDKPARAASLWLIHAGETIWSEVKSTTVEPEDEDDPPAFARVRWDGWKQGLLEAKGKYSDKGTQELVTEALASVEKLEAE